MPFEEHLTRARKILRCGRGGNGAYYLDGTDRAGQREADIAIGVRLVGVLTPLRREHLLVHAVLDGLLKRLLPRAFRFELGGTLWLIAASMPTRTNGWA